MQELIKRARRSVAWRLAKARRITTRVSYALSKRGKQNARALAKLKGRYQNRRIFILGNGPSLLKCKLELLRSEVTIGSNAVYLLGTSHGFRPTFLTVEDPLVAEDRAVDLSALTTSIKIFPLDLADFLRQDEHTLYVNFIRDYSPFPRFSQDFARRVFWGGTVSYLNLQLALFLGCNEIVLIGFDHEYDVRDSVGVGSVIVSTRVDLNHFDPSYFGPGYRWHDPRVDRMERAYIEANRELNAIGVQIYNATAGGKLEVFPRRHFDNFFERADRLTPERTLGQPAPIPRRREYTR